MPRLEERGTAGPQSARDHAAGPDRIAAEPQATDAIVRMCGRLPLALRIVGARMAARPGWPLSAFAERLTDAQNRLDEIRVGDLSVRASFHASYDGICHSGNPIDTTAARAFCSFGVLPGPNMGLPAAAALLGVDLWKAEEALERLVDAHLLHSLAPGRYQMHDLIRLFAREQVCAQEPAAERERALDRVLRHYLATTRQAVSFLDVPPQPAHRAHEEPPTGAVLPTPPLRDRREAEAWLDAEHANLMAAVTHGATQSGSAARLAVRLARPLHWYLYPHARVRELEVLADLVVDIVTGLRSSKNMRWSDPKLSFSRPVRWLVVLYGAAVVPVQVSGLTSGRVSYGHRTDAQPLLSIPSADRLVPLLREHGLVLDPAERRALVVARAEALAAEAGDLALHDVAGGEEDAPVRPVPCG